MDISAEFWRFVEDVHGSPDLSGDEIRGLDSYARLQRIIDGSRPYAIAAEGALRFDAEAPPCFLPEGTRYDGENACYIFDEIENVFYGVQTLLRETETRSVAREARLEQVGACIAKIHRWLDVASLSEDIERGLGV